MSEQPTGGSPAEARVDGLRPAVALLAEIVSTFPDLPAPAVVLHREPALGVTVQLERGCDLEAWREAVGAGPGLVVLHVYAHTVWAEFTALVGGIRVVVYGDVPVAPDVAGVLPAVDAARREQAALLVQRHELEDAPVPPLGGAEPPAQPVTARTLADAHVAPDPAADFRRSVDAGYVTLPDWSPRGGHDAGCAYVGGVGPCSCASDCDPQPTPARETADAPVQGGAL